MRIPLIKTIKANTSEDALFPALDASARVAYSSRDGTARVTIRVDVVECFDQSNGRNETVFWLNDPPSGAWVLTLTESRLVFESPFTMKIFNKKLIEKSGIVSAGNISYKNIAGFRLCDATDRPGTLAVMCMHKDRTISNFVIKADAGTLKELAGLLSRFLADYWKNNGVEDDDVYDQLTTLKNHAWDKQGEITVNLSKAGVEHVFDSLMSAR